MLTGSIEDKEALHTVLVNELRHVYNIKYLKESAKSIKRQNAKPTKNRVFNVPLSNLQLTDAILVNGAVVQVPHFISCSCQMILNHAETEGIFRKAGSAQRLKEIRASLENGKPISRSLNVIDLGDVLKSLFRDLPEPLIAPGSCQEMMLRCLLIPREREQIKALLLVCLLLPPVTLSTLSFFMQFLHKIASHSKVNRMTVQNLAIVFTPSLMPLTEQFNSIRLGNHVKVLEMLIEHSMEIGIVPQEIVDQVAVAANNQQHLLSAQETKAKSKKRRSSSVTRFCVNGLKKIVNNVRRESVENNLDAAGERGGGLKASASCDLSSISQTPLLAAKKRKHIEIASMAETMGFSAKKKRDILPELLSTPLVLKEKKRRQSIISHFRGKNTVTASSSSSSCSQQTLQDVSTTSSQISNVDSPPPPPLPRRWSDATGTPRGKKIAAEQQQQHQFMSPVVSMPCLTLKQSLDHLDELRIPSMNCSPRRRSSGVVMGGGGREEEDEEDFVRIPKREYEAIKNRVSAIEKRISREFEIVQSGGKQSDLSSSSSSNQHHHQQNVDDVAMCSPPSGSNAATVHNKYVRALEETDELNRSTGGTDELAKRLGRDLKIRRSAEHKIIRSPSARKIGSIRRRSSAGQKVNRTKSLTVKGTRREESQDVVMATRQLKVAGERGEGEGQEEEAEYPEVEEVLEGGSFYPRQTSNLKRGRPNTIQTGLRVHRSPPSVSGGRSKEEATMRRRSATIGTLVAGKSSGPSSSGVQFPGSLNEFYPGQGEGMATTAITSATSSNVGVRPAATESLGDEVWTDAKDFFAEKEPPVSILTITPKRMEANERRGSLRSAGRTPTGPGTVLIQPTPQRPVNPEDNLLKTPMLPPKKAGAPRKTPGSAMAKNHYLTPLQQAQQTGRASIARIRSQNAGMVLAKARLFNDLVGDDERPATGAQHQLALDVRRVVQQQQLREKENRETPKTYVTSFKRPQIKPSVLLMANNSPRRLVKTPGREQRATPVRALPRTPPARSTPQQQQVGVRR